MSLTVYNEPEAVAILKKDKNARWDVKGSVIQVYKAHWDTQEALWDYTWEGQEYITANNGQIDNATPRQRSKASWTGSPVAKSVNGQNWFYRKTYWSHEKKDNIVKHLGNEIHYELFMEGHPRFDDVLAMLEHYPEQYEWHYREDGAIEVTHASKASLSRLQLLKSTPSMWGAIKRKPAEPAEPAGQKPKKARKKRVWNLF